MDDWLPPDDKSKTASLSDADISSERVSRRSMLGTLGIGAGVAAAAVLGTTTPAKASDRARCSWRCGSTTDADSGRYADPPNRRVCCGLTDGD
jgi:hypothetical protein